jgi:exonuclease SbcD
MKIAIIADSHFDQHSRFEECVRVHQWIAQDIAERRVDLVLHSGDVYERKSTPIEREAAAAWFQSLALTAPVVVVRGNHDALDDLPLLERLETANPITVVESARMVRAAGAEIACLGWPQKASVLAAAAAEGREVGEQAAADALRSVLRGLGGQFEGSGPRILLAHAMVRGSVTSVGQPLVGCDLELGLDDLALAGADLYALGHIHMPQEWAIAGSPVVYPGSPRRTAFGELEDKGYVIVDFDEGDEFGSEPHVALERVPTPCNPMLHLTAEWTSGALVLVAPETDQIAYGAEIRLRYRVASDEREAARAAAAQIRDLLLGKGALSVKVEEEVATTSRARTPEISAAVTLADKLAALWTLQKNGPAIERRDRLLSKVVELEEESHAA